MKRQRTMMLMFASAALILVSCQKENNVPDGYVDLGLPSGLLWATCNVGATNSNQYGDYYAWGEITTKGVYNWSTYRYCNGDYDQLTKYCSHPSYGSNGFTDNLIILEAIDDVATQRLGDGARIPTKEEWQELFDNTSSEWTTENGISGRKYTSTNGKSIFLPAAGERYDSSLERVGEIGLYWSSSLIVSDTYVAWAMFIGQGGQGESDRDRHAGLSVRPVRSSY